MKKSFTIKALLLLLVVALTSGCVKLEVGLKITNSNVDFNYAIGMQKSYYSMMTGEGDPFKDTTTTLKDDGFTVEDYDDGTYKGIKAVKKLGSLADLSTKDEIKDLTLENDKLENIKIFQITKEGFFKTTYKAVFKTTAMDDIENGINTSGSGSSSNIIDETDKDEDTTTPSTTTDATDTSTTTITSGTDTTTSEKKEEATTPDVDEDIPSITTTGDDFTDVMEATDTTTGTDTQDLDDLNDQLQKSMVVNFKVELPSTPGKNNATKVDGKTLTWDLKTFKDGTIEFEFSTTNTTNVLLVAGGALLLLVIIVAIIVMASKRKGKVEPAEFADKPIPEVVKEEVVTPTEPTADTPELTPVGEPAPKVEAPATEEKTA